MSGSSFTTRVSIAARGVVALLIGIAACSPAIAEVSLYRPPGLKMHKFTCPTYKQENIVQETFYYRSGVKTPWGYTVNRSLRHYKLILSSDFGREIEMLEPHDRWLDIGAGMGNAILDYVSSPNTPAAKAAGENKAPRAKAIAISIEDRRTERWHEVERLLETNQITYLHGRRLREYSTEELGTFDLISDVVGGFTYTGNLSAFMEKVLNLLELDGTFYTILQDINREQGTSHPYRRKAPFLTELVHADGSEAKICSWLKSIACVDVVCEIKTNISPPSEAYRVRKICNAVSVPELELVNFEAGAPPGRRFQLRGTAPQR